MKQLRTFCFELSKDRIMGIDIKHQSYENRYLYMNIMQYYTCRIYYERSFYNSKSRKNCELDNIHTFSKDRKSKFNNTVLSLN